MAHSLSKQFFVLKSFEVFLMKCGKKQ